MLTVVFSVIYLLWRVFFTIPIGYGVVSVIAGVMLLVVEALGLVEALVHYLNMYNARDYVKPEVPEELFPHVDVFISTYNEEPELLKKTILACKRMEYPDKNKVHIYLCDDGHRELVEHLQEYDLVLNKEEMEKLQQLMKEYNKQYISSY